MKKLDRKLSWLLPYLFVLIGCSPTEPIQENVTQTKVVILTDSTEWTDSSAIYLRQRLESYGTRTMMSGEPGETAAAVISRLPWLLQPGVDSFYIDEAFLGSAAVDSLQTALLQFGHPVPLIPYTSIERPPE